MDSEELLNNFIKTLTYLVKLTSHVEDSFFVDKLDTKIEKLAYNFINYQIVLENNGEQDNLFLHKLTTAIDSINELMRDMIYLKLLEPSSLFLEVQKHLLITKLDSIKNKKLFPSKKIVENKKDTFTVKEISKKIPEKIAPLNPSKQKILNFIKSYPDIRTKDIISEFSILSDRTVKRNLTELLKTGVIKKRVDNKATYYSHTKV